jgi:hypothetical protein
LLYDEMTEVGEVIVAYRREEPFDALHARGSVPAPTMRLLMK